MPCIKIIDSIKVYVYAADHPPPHFHILYAEYEELIIINDLTTYIGSVPPKHRQKIIQWASKHQGFIMKQWSKYNTNEINKKDNKNS